ncbi:serine/threonine protein kinase [Pendulispora albinea]|uniref:Serine/threonine protein kinase n=1 Tax=Pendulispora albinea TaxID=2741071 RepID=A0ABZ2MB04_9BACT
MRLLDRYTIIDRIGSGGMASIYRAMDERLDRVVCVKLLRLELEGSGSTSGRSVYQATYSHFLQEALTLSRLMHPNTLRIYDFGYLAQSGRPFQISEFLDGGNLEQHVRSRGACDAEETAAILERISGAVGEAHQHRIIHRDIKPSNILFARVGDYLMPKLADFGIAHSSVVKRAKVGRSTHARGGDLVPGGFEDETSDQVSAVTLFSPRWASPEQLAGSTQGPETDIYALGLVAVYMLAGRPIFEGNDVRGTFADRIRGDELVTRLLSQMDTISEPTRKALLKALSAFPEKRYRSSLSFFDALRRTLIGARPARPPAAFPWKKPRADITMSVEFQVPALQEVANVPPPERAVDLGKARARLVDVDEKLDLTIPSPKGSDVRFRVSFLPLHERSFRINIKGLNCFIRTSGGRPTPAIATDSDGAAHFISTGWEELGEIAWSFGQVASGVDGGRVFRLDGGDMVVPSSQATQSVALFLGSERDVIILCRKS